MELPIVLSVVCTIVRTIPSAIQTLDRLKDLCSSFYCKKELERLQKTVNVVQSVLEDANAKRGALNHQQMNYIEELKYAVYDANDVLDELLTLVKQKELLEANPELSDQVKFLLLSVVPFGPAMSILIKKANEKLVAHNLSKKIKEVNKKLDAIASNASKFMLDVNYKPIQFVKPETSSYVSPSDTIIGRDEDLEKVVGMLLESNEVNVSSLAIVGMGGLGKTAFAQLVYNDPRVTSAFQLKCWTCIADQDEWNLTNILGKIMRELKISNSRDLISLEQIFQEVRKKLEGKKYLLVLDDVWSESYHQWQELEKFLKVGGYGSRIIVTTRSKKTAQNIGGARVHELLGLSCIESVRLFERMAFLPNQIENLDEDLVELGKEIVQKCINVPLAIRVVGSLLRGESKSKWLSFRDLANITKVDDTMNNILSLSYHQLETHLKCCFTYCAIFPKDFEIEKQQLITLWMAQGYINMESEGEEYFRILLQRCFFQNVKEDDNGEIKSFKIHDLLRGIAEQASGREICRLNSELVNVDNKVRHLTLFSDFSPQDTFQKTNIRTLFNVHVGWGCTPHKLLAGNSIGDWKYLRSLDLRYFDGNSLPESISNLFHLRCLDLSESLNLKVLPNSITMLVNLQTLTLRGCVRLTNLPENVSRIPNLSTLDLKRCYELSHMPSNLSMLTNLHTLPSFVVGGVRSSKKRCLDGLKVLRSLNNLKGSLEVVIDVRDENANYKKEDHDGGAYLSGKQHLRKLAINSYSVMLKDESKEWEKLLWNDMQPPVDIKHLSLGRYKGETMPRWPRSDDNSSFFYFPNLVSLEIDWFLELRVLPPLENLPRLKQLSLSALYNIEYVVNVNLIEVLSLGEGSAFFPCLELLRITRLHKLKGWWPRSEEQKEPFPCFAKLKRLEINECDMLKFIPICSSLNSVTLDNMEVLPKSYQSSLPSDSKSRFITLSDIRKSPKHG